MTRLAFAPCSKCGEPEPAIKYHRDGSSLSCPDSHLGIGEHFHLTCTRCGYSATTTLAKAMEEASAEASETPA